MEHRRQEEKPRRQPWVTRGILAALLGLNLFVIATPGYGDDGMDEYYIYEKLIDCKYKCGAAVTLENVLLFINRSDSRCTYTAGKTSKNFLPMYITPCIPVSLGAQIISYSCTQLNIGDGSQPGVTYQGSPSDIHYNIPSWPSSVNCGLRAAVVGDIVYIFSSQDTKTVTMDSFRMSYNSNAGTYTFTYGPTRTVNYSIDGNNWKWFKVLGSDAGLYFVARQNEADFTNGPKLDISFISTDILDSPASTIVPSSPAIPGGH
jgi:hypothetical protein